MGALRCLVFTEDAAFDGWLREVLFMMSADVVVTSSATQAARLLREVDVAIATLSWPHASTLAWVRRARAEGCAAPIVFLASYADVDLRTAVRTIGGIVLVDKYLTEDELRLQLHCIRGKAQAASEPPRIAITVREKRPRRKRPRPEPRSQPAAPVPRPEVPPPTVTPRRLA